MTNDNVSKLRELADLLVKQASHEKGHQFDRKRPGSLFDRGSADSYYHRPRKPHWYPNGTGYHPRIEDLTPEEIAEYHAGYDDNEGILGNKKQWEEKPY